MTISRKGVKKAVKENKKLKDLITDREFKIIDNINDKTAEVLGTPSAVAAGTDPKTWNSYSNPEMNIMVQHTYYIDKFNEWHESKHERKYFDDIDLAVEDIKRRIKEDGNRPKFSLQLDITKA